MTKVEKFILENWESVIRVNTKDKDTLIGLPYPYTVPCAEGKFQELYYWDTYFTNVGLMLQGKIEIAKNNVNNMLFLVEKFGFMPNGNRTHYQYRSQPPFLSQMVLELYAETKDIDWLFKAYCTLEKEYSFWQKERITPSGLNRYHGQIKDFTESASSLCRRVGLDMPSDIKTKNRYGESAYSLCESGWDCSSRFAFFAQDINPVCLNSLLYGFEKNMAYFSKVLGNGDSKDWNRRSIERKMLMNNIMWDKNIGAFCDYNFVENKRRTLASTAMFYPMFFNLEDENQSNQTIKTLKKLEQKYGVACCENREDILSLQWDYPHGWACQQYMVIKALLNYGFVSEANRIAQKYVDVVDKVFDETGHLWEKYNVLSGTVSVTKEYVTPTMMGWSAGVYIYCNKFLKGEKR